MRWVALLKGVNVGGNRKLPMSDLRGIVERLDYHEVKTLLASGNVVFACDGKDARKIEATIETALGEAGLSTEVLLRNAADFDKIIAGNPFVDAAKNRPNHLLVHFHRVPVPKEPLAKLPELYDGPERLEAKSRELYIDYPADIGHSKLPQAMAKAKFPKLATARNWNTVTKLAVMLVA